MKIKIFTTGGTIDKVYFDRQSRYQVGEPRVEEILREADVSLSYSIESIFRKDSLELTDADRRIICEKVANASETRIIITHGTATIVDTGRLLQSISGKVTVLTGAMKPANFKESDAPFNIGCAIAAVQILAPGVYITMNGHVFPADRVQKNYQSLRFETYP